MKSNIDTPPQLKDIKAAIISLCKDLGLHLLHNQKSRHVVSLGLAVLIHISLFSAHMVLSSLEQPEVLEIREITFVDETTLPVINQPQNGEAVPLEPEPLEEELFPSRARSLAQNEEESSGAEGAISLSERLDMQRKQAPLNLARNSSVLAKGNSDVLNLSPAQGTRLDSRIKNPSAPIKLARKGDPGLVHRSNNGGLNLDDSAKPKIVLAKNDLKASPITAEQSAGGAKQTSSEMTSPSFAPKKTSTVITGQLASREILHKVMPEFPARARKQGVGASIALKFSVMETGKVKENVIVVRTSGSGAWDETVIDALKKWRFAPLDTKGQRQDQTGIITFQFVIR